MQKIIAVLPAYNEEACIIDLLQNFNAIATIYQLPLEILIINDGSKDRTVEFARSVSLNIPLHIIDNHLNGGLGKVISQGFYDACDRLSENDIIITMDSDNSHSPGLIPKMIQQINEGSDIVIASRYRHGSRVYGLGAFRKLTGFFAGSLFFIFASIKGVRDYTCGFRAYKVSILKRGFSHFGNKFVEEPGFTCMVEILLKLNVFNPIVHEVPMILRYDLKLGASKMKVWATIKKTLSVLWDYRMSKRFK